MKKRTYRYVVEKDQDSNIVSIEPVQKNTKTTIIKTSENYLDVETSYKLSVNDIIDIILAPAIFISFVASCILIVMGIL